MVPTFALFSVAACHPFLSIHFFPLEFCARSVFEKDNAAMAVSVVGVLLLRKMLGMFSILERGFVGCKCLKPTFWQVRCWFFVTHCT
jgi:hypothetical protein